MIRIKDVIQLSGKRPIQNLYMYQNKKYKSIIPLNIFQTWYTKTLSEKMLHAMLEIKRNNPEFKHYLFDDNECYQFINTYFGPDVSRAYNSLVPGAYKADLWRYCVLFVHGGIYLDVKYTNIDNFKLIELTEKEHWCLDANDKDVYNAILVCKPKNEILLKAIKQIVENVKNKFYGDVNLEPTGPALLSKYFTEEEKKQFVMKHIVNTENGDVKKVIIFDRQPILKSYTGYYADNKKKHYSTLWLEKKIYL